MNTQTSQYHYMKDINVVCLPIQESSLHCLPKVTKNYILISPYYNNICTNILCLYNAIRVTLIVFVY